jgi:hypothetical protein
MNKIGNNPRKKISPKISFDWIILFMTVFLLFWIGLLADAAVWKQVVLVKDIIDDILCFSFVIRI